MKEKVKEWIELAKMDLAASFKLQDSEELTPVASFHAHQSVEKTFKAIIEHNDHIVPKIHDLIRLNNEIKNLIKIDFDENMLDDLSRLYIDSRYPAMIGHTSYGKPSIDDTRHYVNFAKKVLNEVIDKLG